MLARLALLAVSLLMAAAASANPLTGVWQSDRDVTLFEGDKPATLTLEQRELLSDRDLFAQLLAIPEDREIEFRAGEGTTHLSYRVVATGSDFVEVGYGDAGFAEPSRKRLLLQGGLLHVPVEDLGFHEVLRRIEEPAALAR